MNIDNFEQHFGQLDDVRQSAKITYPLFDILLVTLCAVIAGAEGWKDIKGFIRKMHTCLHDLLLFLAQKTPNLDIHKQF